MFYSDVPLSCINEAAYEYHVPAKLIIAVLNVEQGKVGMANRNKNGTYDLGPMQINTSWWPKLSQYGISQWDVQNNPCINIKVGAWILSKNIADQSNLLIGIGNYHSLEPIKNSAYTNKIRLIYTFDLN
ncbi:MAG: trbN [Gammaproteobacteria bacterium]|jgi:hypothetical protein|nr:trbN [Gammaproteobacteria bacterium]